MPCCIVLEVNVFSSTSRSMMPKALDGQIVMEKTPRYFVTVETPARVHAMSQDVKLIVVVRDPVTRAISDYTQIISKTPDIPPFESLAFKNRTTGTNHGVPVQVSVCPKGQSHTTQVLKAALHKKAHIL